MAVQYPWRHDKKLRLRDEDLYSEDYRGPTSGKRKWPCKKLKGLHQFAFKSKNEFRFMKGGWDDFECIACGKRKVVHFD